jgi:hypothetical protein
LLASSLCRQGELAVEQGAKAEAQKLLFESAAWYFELGRVHPRRFFDTWRQIQTNLRAIDPSFPNQVRILPGVAGAIFEELGRTRSELMAFGPSENIVRLETDQPWEPAGEKLPVLLLTDPSDNGSIILHKQLLNLGEANNFLGVSAAKLRPLRTEEKRSVDNTRFGTAPPDPLDICSPVFYKPWFVVWTDRIAEWKTTDFKSVLLLLDMSLAHVERVITQDADLFSAAHAYLAWQMSEATAGFADRLPHLFWLIEAARLHIRFFEDNRRRTTEIPVRVLQAMPFLKMALERISQRVSDAITPSLPPVATNQQAEIFAALIRTQTEIQRVMSS